jgi:hypothetical protein
VYSDRVGVGVHDVGVKRGMLTQSTNQRRRNALIIGSIPLAKDPANIETGKSKAPTGESERTERLSIYCERGVRSFLGALQTAHHKMRNVGNLWICALAAGSTVWANENYARQAGNADILSDINVISRYWGAS